MDKRQVISESIIGCRNVLFGGVGGENILSCLQNILKNIDLVKIPTTKRIIEYCVAEAIDQVQSKNFISAGRILNLIHNLPLEKENEEKWDIDYFLSMEIPIFLEDFKEVQHARRITLYVFKQIACQYLKE